jgi:hypothetical protein
MPDDAGLFRQHPIIANRERAPKSGSRLGAEAAGTGSAGQNARPRRQVRAFQGAASTHWPANCPARQRSRATSRVRREDRRTEAGRARAGERMRGSQQRNNLYKIIEQLFTRNILSLSETAISTQYGACRPPSWRPHQRNTASSSGKKPKSVERSE